MFSPISLSMHPLPGFSIEPEEAKSILRPQKSASIGCQFTLAPYRGCAHACPYCYLRDYPHERHSPGEWGHWVAPKLNAPALLWQQRHKLQGQKVFVSAATDPYQPLEAQYGLTRACLETLLCCPTTEVVIHTRSSLILRDLQLLQAFGSRLQVGLSLTTDDEAIRLLAEPRAPPLEERMHVLETLSKAGIWTGLSIAPLLPFRDPTDFAFRARALGAHSTWVGALRLLPSDPFRSIIRQQGWDYILDQNYIQSVKRSFQRIFPAIRTAPNGKKVPLPLSSATPTSFQPYLFDLQ